MSVCACSSRTVCCSLNIYCLDCVEIENQKKKGKEKNWFQRDRASAAMQELVRFTGGDRCPTVSQSVSWCFRYVSSRGDIPALLTLRQSKQTEGNTLLPSCSIPPHFLNLSVLYLFLFLSRYNHTARHAVK